MTFSRVKGGWQPNVISAQENGPVREREGKQDVNRSVLSGFVLLMSALKGRVSTQNEQKSTTLFGWIWKKRKGIFLCCRTNDI